MMKFSNASEYLGYPQFGTTIMFAMLLHIMGGIVIYMSPNIRIVDIPVKPINIRLGDSDVQQLVEDEPAPQPELSTSQEVDDAMSKLIRKSETEKVAKKVPVPDASKTNENTNNQAATKTIKQRVDAPRQFVRFTPPNTENLNDGTVIGNSSDSKAEIKARYEQTISLWIQKFKLYPDEAKEAGETNDFRVVNDHGNVTVYSANGDEIIGIV